MRSSVWLTRAVALPAGALPILAFPRADLGWLAWVALVPGLLLLANAPTKREAGLRGWAFGVGYLLAALSWTLPYIGPALPLIAVVFGALWGLWGIATRILVPRHPGLALLVLPSVWVAIEVARSRPALGGPWAVYGATQWQHPTELSLAALGGVWLISFALVAANTALTLVLTRLPAISLRRRPDSSPTPTTAGAAPSATYPSTREPPTTVHRTAESPQPPAAPSTPTLSGTDPHGSAPSAPVADESSQSAQPATTQVRPDDSAPRDAETGQPAANVPESIPSALARHEFAVSMPQGTERLSVAPYPAPGSHDPTSGPHDRIVASHDPIGSSHDLIVGSHDLLVSSHDAIDGREAALKGGPEPPAHTAGEERTASLTVTLDTSVQGDGGERRGEAAAEEDDETRSRTERADLGSGAGRGRADRHGGTGGGHARLWFLVGMAALALAIAGLGPFVFLIRGEPAAARTVRMNLVQTGVVEGPEKRLETGFQLTESAPSADLTVWGESSVGVDLDRNPAVVRRLRALAAARGPLLVNVDAEDARGRISKTAVLVGPEGLRARYTKTRLVPFGEYIPFRDAFGWLSRISKAAGQDRVPGTGPTVMTAGGTTFGPLICFESAFPDLGRTLVRHGAEVIVYQSATSSFQNSWAPAQHASLAAVRAAETGRPVVQAALTGVSAGFDARGRRIVWFDIDRRGTVTVALAVPSTASRTPYDRLGDVVPLVSLVTSAGMIVFSVWNRQKEVKGAGVTKRR
ncbi:apolipoprotein N-acyltransferase [Actinomadura logoneensis]|uniref:Apolipoprotein N-acyltransferase n=1 Tax=Actinomadura logoneensis TaxID=2293572 RepID=A0A372JLY8_9ACTN|nr:apolipoprotein N-acyltransferase [Actinomadura logoneensis]RFU40959.1 apolipoprotein N-acyltransferase [Actinomadura logoneensis]